LSQACRKAIKAPSIEEEKYDPSLRNVNTCEQYRNLKSSKKGMKLGIKLLFRGIEDGY